MKPVIKALADLGGSGAVEEIREKVIECLSIPDDIANSPHNTKRPSAQNRTELEYNLAWARTYLKQLGFLENSARGIWSLTGKGWAQDAQTQVGNFGPEKAAFDNARGEKQDNPNIASGDWKDELNRVLTEILSPTAFEHLIQRVLRETGFVQVEVTGRTADGGIDGKGIAKINGILSFHVVFQCKRYKGGVGAPPIRDFRGALQGRADKGLFITTGYFTRDAIKEATRDGAIAIDLVDGEKLAEKLKELRLGVSVELTECVRIEKDWFNSLTDAPKAK